jgi:hypothetical protein
MNVSPESKTSHRINSVFNNISFNNEKDKITIRKAVQTYSKDITKQLKNMDIKDSDIKRYTNKFHIPKPQSFDFLMEGMKRIIFGPEGLFKRMKTEIPKKAKPIKLQDEHKIKRKLFHKFKVINIKPKTLDKKDSAFFITNYESVKKNIYPSCEFDFSESTARSTQLIVVPSLKLESNIDDEKNNFLKKFSRNNIKRKCSEIYHDNINLLKQFSLEMSNSTSRILDSKRKEYVTDRAIFGDIESRVGPASRIRNKSTGICEYLGKPKIDLIKFGENVNKISDTLALGYKDYLENTYSVLAKNANVEYEENVKQVKHNKFIKAKRNSAQMHILKKIIQSKRNSIMGT